MISMCGWTKAVSETQIYSLFILFCLLWIIKVLSWGYHIVLGSAITAGGGHGGGTLLSGPYWIMYVPQGVTILLEKRRNNNSQASDEKPARISITLAVITTLECRKDWQVPDSHLKSLIPTRESYFLHCNIIPKKNNLCHKLVKS